MRRRDLLAAVAGGTTVGVAGCLASDRSIGEFGRTGEGNESDDDSRVIGGEERDDDGAHRLRLENEGDSSREVTIEISIDGESVHEETRELSPGDRREFRLVEPTEYSVSIESDGSSTELGLSGPSPECRESTTTVALSESGLSTQMTSSASDCEPRETTVSSEDGIERDEPAGFEHGDGECARERERDHATIDIERDTISVDGGVETPTPCHRLSLAALDEDAADETLELVVRAEDPETELCVQCIGLVPYTAEIELPEPRPDSVAVIHETMGERRTVREVDC